MTLPDLENHGVRNAADYGGNFQVNERLLRDMIAATTAVRQRLLGLGPVLSQD